MTESPGIRPITFVFELSQLTNQEISMLRVSVGKSRKLSENFNSHGFNITVDGEINAPLDDPERVINQIHELFDIADEALSDQIERFESGAINKPVIKKQLSETLSSRSQNTDDPGGQHRRTLSNGNSQSSSQSAATDKQVQFLQNLGRQQGLSQNELESHVAKMLNFSQAKKVHDLSKFEAASAIDQLVNSR